MTKKKQIIIISGVSVFVLAVAVIAAWLIGSGYDFADDARVSVYFFNESMGRLEAEERHLPRGNMENRIETLLGYFVDGPQGEGLSHVWPLQHDVREFITRLQLNGDELVARFSYLYNEMPTVDEALFRSALTLTMVGLPYLESVKFYVSCEYGENPREWVETAESIANNPSISAVLRSSDVFTLYFADETGEGLVAWLHIAEDVDVHGRLIYMLERLIDGQSATGVFPLIPQETRVRDVIVDTMVGAIYVDLSGEFHRNFAGTSAQARMMLQSITHSLLTSMPGTGGPRRVFFLIDSERREDFHGVSDFHLGFVEDESFMLGYVPVVEEN